MMASEEFMEYGNCLAYEKPKVGQIWDGELVTEESLKRLRIVDAALDGPGKPNSKFTAIFLEGE